MKKQISLKLKEYRHCKNLSQKDLSKILEVSEGAVANWESGLRIPKMETLHKISKLIDCTIDQLIN